jgi:hypothetical protein
VFENPMRSHLPAALAAALLAALAALASVAVAGEQVVRDDRAETKQLKRHPRLDILRATAGHRDGLLVHTVTMRRAVAPERGKERPLIGLNVRGGPRSELEFLVFGGSVFKLRSNGDPKVVADAELTSRGRRWVYVFDPDEVGLTRYGWAAITVKGRTSDVAPADRYRKHRA